MTTRLSVILTADMVGYSRLMERDQTGTLSRQSAYRKTLIDPAIAEVGGTIVKGTGDGLFATFPNLKGAVDTAIEIQTAMAREEADIAVEDAIRYRIGIHVGDVSFEDDDLFGDAVNLAARLEAVSEPGGICLSDPCYQLLDRPTQRLFSDVGLQRLKNLRRMVRAWQWTLETRQRNTAHRDFGLLQKISFCVTPDNVQLAYATLGDGPAVLKAPNWMNHLDYDWQNRILASSLSVLAEQNTLVRFDQRGNGLSDWDVENISEDAMISDMKCVVEAAGLRRFALFGISQGCSFSIRYAVENPDQVSCLILSSGYARGRLRRRDAEQERLHMATNAMIREGWGSRNHAFRHIFTETMIPDADAAAKSQMDEMQRVATSADCANRINEMNAGIDVSDLARQLDVPTLVMHAKDERSVPFEEGRRIAALIPGAEFVALPGNNHIPIEGTEAFDIFKEKTHEFLKRHAG